jgi:hypothetical protein
MIVASCSGDIHAHEGESHGVFAMVTKALVTQSSVNRRGTNTFVSKEVIALTGKTMKVKKKIVVHDEDEVAV